MIKLELYFLWHQSKFQCRIMVKRLICSHVVLLCTIYFAGSIQYINTEILRYPTKTKLQLQNQINGTILNTLARKHLLISYISDLGWQLTSLAGYLEFHRYKDMMLRELYNIPG